MRRSLPTQTAPRSAALDMLDWDHLEFYVGNAKQAAHYYATAFGFAVEAYAGPETGVSDRASYCLVQHDLRFVLTSALRPDGPIADHVARHGDGIRDVALRVPDARAAFEAAVAGGAAALGEPRVLSDQDGEVVLARIRTYGETVHTFVERERYGGAFMPGFVRLSGQARGRHPPGARALGH